MNKKYDICALYLQKIGINEEEITANLDNLNLVLHQHVQTFTFGNIAPFLGQPVDLDVESIAEKFLINGREGYCFEHNLLAKHVLNELGFEAFNILCRVYFKSQPTQAPAKTHLITIVKLNDQLYLFDPGFGGVTPTSALSFGIKGVTQNTPIDSYRIIPANESGIDSIALADETLVLQIYEAGRWENMYGFNLVHEAVDADIKLSNWYVSTHPESKFTQNLVLTIVDQKTRYNFSNGRLTICDENGRSEQFFTTTKDIQKMIKAIFKLDTKNIDFDQLMVKLETKSP